MERRKLTTEEINDALKGMEGWTVEADAIKRRYEFKNFAESLAFVNKVGEIAEASDHHPDITFGWGYAEIATTTHDRGGVTNVDLALAAEISSLQ